MAGVMARCSRVDVNSSLIHPFSTLGAFVQVLLLAIPDVAFLVCEPHIQNQMGWLLLLLIGSDRLGRAARLALRGNLRHTRNWLTRGGRWPRRFRFGAFKRAQGGEEVCGRRVLLLFRLRFQCARNALCYVGGALELSPPPPQLENLVTPLEL